MTTKEQKTQLAKDYLNKHNIKNIYEKLVYEVTLFRPKDPIQYFINRLEELKKKGLDDEKHIPRIILILSAPLSKSSEFMNALEQQMDILYINVNDLVNKEINSGSQEGKMMDEILKQGGLIPTQVLVTQIEKNHKFDQEKRLIFIEGVCNSLKQALEFEKLVIDCQFVLHFQLDDEEFQTRLNSLKPSDEAVEKQYQEYKQRRVSLSQFYEYWGKYKVVDAKLTTQEVISELQKCL